MRQTSPTPKNEIYRPWWGGRLIALTIVLVSLNNGVKLLPVLDSYHKRRYKNGTKNLPEGWQSGTEFTDLQWDVNDCS